MQVQHPNETVNFITPNEILYSAVSDRSAIRSSVYKLKVDKRNRHAVTCSAASARKPGASAVACVSCETELACGSRRSCCSGAAYQWQVK